MLPSMRRQAAKTRTKLTLGLMALLSCLLAAQRPCCGRLLGKVRGLGALAQERAALPATEARVERSEARERPFSPALDPGFRCAQSGLCARFASGRPLTRAHKSNNLGPTSVGRTSEDRKSLV